MPETSQLMSTSLYYAVYSLCHRDTDNAETKENDGYCEVSVDVLK